MKSYSLIISAALICALFSCKQETHHQDLITWIETADFNGLNFQPEAKDSIAIDILEKYIFINNLANDPSFVSTILADKMDTNDVKRYHTVFKNRRDITKALTLPQLDTFQIMKDTIDAVLISFDRLYNAMLYHYGDELDTYSKLGDIGFLVYFANYGKKGRLVNGSFVDKYKSSVILHLAKKDPSNPNYWIAIEDECYDFGGLKPPTQVTGSY